MNLNKSVERLLIIIAVCFIVVLGAYSVYNNYKQLSQYKEVSLKAQSELKEFKLKRLADSSTIVTQQQLLVSEKNAVALKLVELQDGFKSLQAQIKSTTMTHFDALDVPFVPYGYADTTGGKLVDTVGLNLVKREYLPEDSGYLKTPSPFAYNSKWLTATGFVGAKRIHFDSINIPNKVTVTIGEKYKSNNFFYKINPFKKLEPVVDIKNDNPYVNVMAASNVIIKNEKSAFAKTLNTTKNVALIYVVGKIVFSLIKK